MHRSSETIGAIAAALAKAQGELSNPEKSLIATIRSPFPRESDRTFRYASLASGLDIVRKALGQNEIATIQTTEIDQATGQIRLNTVLAHASGEWIASDWPVCPTSETANPHRMGAALSYARRYALFALVGIAGEDDLDAPDLMVEPSPAITPPADSRVPTSRRNGVVHKPVLNSEASAALRDELVAEIGGLNENDQMALWAHRRLPAKNTLMTGDAAIVERAYLAVLNSSPDNVINQVSEVEPDQQVPVSGNPENGSKSLPILLKSESSAGNHLVTPIRKTVRQRNKRHLRFVASQPCLVCQRKPCDAHHVKFAEPRALGRKVSDEFTVPLCREHHQELHRKGDERAWWADINLAPLDVAQILWDATMSGRDNTFSPADKNPNAMQGIATK